MATTPVKATRRTLSASIADDLLLKIREGALAPGAKLPIEKELMAQYGVGRNTVREAVQSLVTMGYLDVRPRVGARVIGVPTADALETAAVAALLTGEAISDIYELRHTLETEIAFRASTMATTADHEHIGAALQDYERAARDGVDPYRADVAFHAALAHASHNVAFANVLEAASDLLLRARKLTDHVPGAVSLALEEHTTIAEAIFARDPEKARRAMQIHMDTSIAAWHRAQRLFSTSKDPA
ncbi:FadR/GntR family transcriptional regulator [Microbacterium sp. bgisy207]|uniref:FadR/GntR family transcriptional regulator n=1 Tax=Microbacterium sp. bgisy207 TaxID=3413800 RepID=UPI003EBD1C60